MAGIYIHIPFCLQICHYCDFYKDTSIHNKRKFVEALCKEIELRKHEVSESIQTIYFGGGTPSLLSQDDLSAIFNQIYKDYNVESHAEITLEANPDDLKEEHLNMLKESLVNRLSIGIQSFQDDILRFLHRRHKAHQAVEAVKRAQDKGFTNIGIDLIYGIPGMSNSDWKASINQAVDLKVEHISAYHLGIESGTQFGRLKEQGKLKEIDEEVSLDQHKVLRETLLHEGYRNYEISNFCKPGYISQHNSSYWKGKAYLGFGPSAHSFMGDKRQWNIRNTNEYIQSIFKGHIPSESEIISLKDSYNEYIMTNLRTDWGCDLGYIRDHYPEQYVNSFLSTLEHFQKEELFIIDNEAIKMRPERWFISDSVISDFFIL